MFENLTNQTKGLLDNLSKFSTASGELTTYVDLSTPAKRLLTFNSPILDSLPRTSVFGASVSWDTLVKMIALGDGTGTEGAKGGSTKFKYEPSMVTIKKQSLSGDISDKVELLDAAKRDTIKASNYIYTLAKLKELVEMMIIGGTTTNLDTPAKPTAVVDADGGEIEAATYKVTVCALTSQGIYDIPCDIQDEDLELRPNGYTDLSPVSDDVVVAANGAALVLSVEPVDNAFAYAFFVGVGAAMKLQVVSSASTVTITKIVATGQASSTITENKSGNENAFDGLTTQGIKGGAYHKKMAYTKLTKSNAGGVVELDEMLEHFSRRLKLSPDIIYCGSQAHIDISTACLQSNNGLQQQVVVPADGKVSANTLVEIYRNKSRGLKALPIVTHPLFPPNLIVVLTTTIPYQNTRISNMMDMAVLEEFRAKDYAETDDFVEYSVKCWSAFRHFMPKSMGIISNLQAGVQ